MPAYVLVFVLLGQYDASSALQRGAARRVRPRLPAPGGALHGGGDRGAHARAVPVRVRARARRVPRAVARHDGGGAHARPQPRARDPARRAAAGPARAGRRRGARDDGGARRLRRRQPPQLPRDDRRDLPRLVRRVRPRGGPAARHACSSGSTLSLVVLERLLRGRARYQQALVRGEAVVPRRLRGGARAPAPALPVLLLLVVSWRRSPSSSCGRSSRWATGRRRGDLARDGAAAASLLAAITALIAVGAATVVVYGRRDRPSRAGAVCRAPHLARLRGARHRGRRRRLHAARLARPPPRRRGPRAARGRPRPGDHRDGARARARLRRALPRARVLRGRRADARASTRRSTTPPAASAPTADRMLSDVHLPLLWPGILTARCSCSSRS